MRRIHAKTLHIEKLCATLALMKRARFGRSSERIEQLELLIGDLEEEAAEQQARATGRPACAESAFLEDGRASPARAPAVAGPGLKQGYRPIGCLSHRASAWCTRRPASARPAAAPA